MMGNPDISNEQFMKIIEDNLKNDLSVAFLAKHFGYSEFYFCRVFKKQMGLPVMEYVCKRRLSVAVDEIMKGEKIIDVAFNFGWQSHNGFSKAFKKELGYSPSLLKALLVGIKKIGGDSMKDRSLSKTDLHLSKEELIKTLKETINHNGIEIRRNFDEIIEYAISVYEGMTRYSGDEYITHTLNVAIILASFESEISIIEAGLFCDAGKKAKDRLENVLPLLPIDLRNIIEKINISGNNLENISEDTLLVKIAERIHNMRTVEYMNEESRYAKVKETIEIFMPVARRLKNNRIMEELNDLCVKYI